MNWGSAKASNHCGASGEDTCACAYTSAGLANPQSTRVCLVGLGGRVKPQWAIATQAGLSEKVN